MKIMVMTGDESNAAPPIAAFRSRGDTVELADTVGPWAEQCDGRAYSLLLMLSLARPQSICGELRRRGTTVPILVASEANSASQERASALRAGADDCIPAPFEVEELILRSDALVRRSANAYDYPQQLGPLVLRPRAREAYVDDRRAALTDREFELLSLFVRHAGRTVTRSEIIDAVWGASEPESNVLEVHVRRVRAKLGRYAGFLETVRGVGYRLLPPVLAPTRSDENRFAPTLPMLLRAGNE